MPYIPEQLLKCVVFVGYEDETGNKHFMGSAFWISRPGPEDIRQVFRPSYLVTAAHVIDDVRKRLAPGSSRVLVRMNTPAGGQIWEDTPLHWWKTHPDSGADLAVMKIHIDEGRWDHLAWPTEAFVNSTSAEEDGGRRIELGDELALAGLFYPHTGKERNIPIVRVANIAALRGEPVVNRDGYPMDAYLVECRSIGGLSGSPVFYDIYAAKRSFQGEFRHVMTPIQFRLLGVMHGHFNAPDLKADAVAGNPIKDTDLINMGIAIVIPAERIVEVLNCFADEEAREAERFRQSKGVSTQLAAVEAPDSGANR